jgi:anti-sigma factor RsiW
VSCRQTATRLDAFMDGELPTEHTLEVEEHLASCAACRERSEFENALRGSLRRVVRAESASSDGFEARLAAAMRAERERILSTPSVPPRPKRKGSVGVPLFLAAAAAVTLVIGLDKQNDSTSGGLAANTNASDVPNVPNVMLRPVKIEQETPEQVLDELVDYHTTPPTPQITEQRFIEKLEPEVGVPVRMPELVRYGAAWEGGSVVAMRNQRAAVLRYRVSNHPVTIYVYDAGRVPLRGVLEPQVVHNKPIHVGQRRGYSIAALERSGVGYAAVATDMNETENAAEMVSTIY